MVPMTIRPLVTALLVMLLTGFLAGCSDAPGKDSTSPSSAPTSYGKETPGSLHPGDPIPPPQGKPVLTFRGTPTTNVGNTLQFDLATLEKFDSVSYRAYDRQGEGRELTFSGPLLGTLLKAAGVTEYKSLHCLALNDYAVDIPASDIDTLPVLLATRADGKQMSVAHYGPTRVVYPTEGFDLPGFRYDPRWIWQLAVIDVQ